MPNFELELRWYLKNSSLSNWYEFHQLNFGYTPILSECKVLYTSNFTDDELEYFKLYDTIHYN